MQKACFGLQKSWEINGKSTRAPPGPPALGCRQGLQNKAFWHADPARRSHPRRRPGATGRPPVPSWAKSLFRHTKTMCRHANHDLACRKHVSACNKSCFGMQNHDLECRKQVSACNETCFGMQHHVSACEIMIWNAESMFRHAIKNILACKIMFRYAES